MLRAGIRDIETLLQNRVGWLMGTLAAIALLAALSVGITGYRNTPRPQQPLAAAGAASPADEGDPLAPRFLERSDTVRIHVAGAVKKPGVYTLPAWARVIDAVKKAGDFSPAADPDAINLADRLRDGEQLRIPVRGDTARLTGHQPTPEPAPVPSTTGGRGLGRYPFAAAAGPREGGTIDLNSATLEELDGLPGVGPATAEKIIAHRKEHGPFLQAEDLMNVKGIGPAKFEKLRHLVIVQ